MQRVLSHFILATTAVALAACQTPGPSPTLPPALAVASQETLVDTLSARGVQIYECRESAGRPVWTFVAPEAELFARGGRSYGQHGAGPTWQAADGSLVVGEVIARADAPVAGAIPWLLLKTRSTGREGTLSTVTRIRRVHTAGGVAPADGCDARTLGAKLRVPYTADYLLYTGSAA